MYAKNVIVRIMNCEITQNIQMVRSIANSTYDKYNENNKDMNVRAKNAFIR